MLDKAVMTIDRYMITLLDWSIVAIAGLLLILLNYAVFARFVLNASVSWGEELPAHLLAALTFIGAAYLTRTNEHLGFDSVVAILPRAAQRIVMAGNLILMTGFSICLTYFGTVAAISFTGRALISIDLPMAIFRGAMPVGAAIMTIVCAARLIGIVTGRLDPADMLPRSDG